MTDLLADRNALVEKARVLVVDDIHLNQVVMSCILEELSVDVDVASSGEEALILVAQHEYAVILMDVQMPEMSGFECVATMRGMPSEQKTPIIFVTAIGDDEKYMGQGYRLGAVDYIVKPVDADTLKTKVNVVIELHDQRIMLQHSLAESKSIQRKNDQLLNYMAEGILGLDKSNVITFANIAACTLLTSNRNQVVGRSIKDFINPELSQEGWDQSEFTSIFKDGQCNHMDDAVFWRNKNENFPVEYTQATILDDDKVVGGVVAFQDISERKKDQQKLINLARYDQLTQLANRSMYWDYLNKSIAGAKRSNSKIEVLFLDLDNFKQVNDSLGHDAGDELLILVSKRLKQCVRDADIVARMGGDEFAVLLIDPRDTQVAAKISQKIIDELVEPFNIFSNEVSIKASIGIAVYPENGNTATQLTKAADTAMYHAKSSGRNTFKYFSRKMHERIQMDMKITQELSKAISNQELALNFQPQINITNNRLVGFEALIRWLHPDMGQVSPDEFIPIAETNGLITDIGDWCLLQALQQVRDWNDTLPINHQVNIAINVSSIQFSKPHFSEYIINLVKRSGLPAKCIELEITETAIMENPLQTANELYKLRSAGIRISMDDFGTGYSSLAQLKNCPLMY